MSNRIQAKKGDGLVSLPSAKDRSAIKFVWNIYLDHKDNKHYYHTVPFDRKDKLIKANIRVENAMKIIEDLNRELGMRK